MTTKTVGQSRRGSLVETITNVAIGYGVSIISQLVIFPQFGIHIPLHSNILIGCWFTVISIIRSYVLRRWFNYSIARRQ